MRVRLIFIVVMTVLCVTSCAQSPKSVIDKRIEEVENGLIRAYGDSPAFPVDRELWPWACHE